jgi:uncharacterized membrane protein SpoIIM required for sporulation/ABC-type transport system involved in multi-copper enzyme maturation permease subunit
MTEKYSMTQPSLSLYWREIRKEFQATLLVARREVRDQFRDWRIIFPILGLTLFFPFLMNFTAGQIVSFVERYGAPILAERLIPFLLMIVGFFPISISLVIALESFVGEKERHSIEPLLNTPLTDLQLYLGKLIAAMVPPLLAAYIGIIVYTLGVYHQVGWQAPKSLFIQIVVLTTVQALVMVSGAIVVSSQATTVRAANLLASFIILPMALLIQGESMVMFWGRSNTLWWVILAQVVIAALLVRSGVAHFNREELLGRELDTLNMGWIWRTFWNAFTGQASNLWQWYRIEIVQTLRRIALPAILTLPALVGGIYAGTTQAKIFILPTQALQLPGLSKGFMSSIGALQFFSATGVSLVWLQNMRALLLASLMGIFTYGVLGILVVVLPFALIGYFMASLTVIGISPLNFLLAFVLPHGIVEIPAIMLAGGAILQTGAAIAAPSTKYSVGEALLHAIADWARVMIGLVAPLLLIAAALEVLVTPSVALKILGGG